MSAYHAIPQTGEPVYSLDRHRDQHHLDHVLEADILRLSNMVNDIFCTTTVAYVVGIAFQPRPRLLNILQHNLASHFNNQRVMRSVLESNISQWLSSPHPKICQFNDSHEANTSSPMDICFFLHGSADSLEAIFHCLIIGLPEGASSIPLEKYAKKAEIILRDWMKPKYKLEEEKSRNALLSAREQEILNWIKAGKTNFEIASILDISPYTVKNHVKKILEKMAVPNRISAAMKRLS